MRLDGDAAFALQVHAVEDLGLHLARLQGPGHLEESVGQGRLAVVDVRHDGEIADEALFQHVGFGEPSIMAHPAALSRLPGRAGCAAGAEIGEDAPHADSRSWHRRRARPGDGADGRRSRARVRRRSGRRPDAGRVLHALDHPLLRAGVPVPGRHVRLPPRCSPRGPRRRVVASGQPRSVPRAAGADRAPRRLDLQRRRLELQPGRGDLADRVVPGGAVDAHPAPARRGCRDRGGDRRRPQRLGAGRVRRRRHGRRLAGAGALHRRQLPHGRYRAAAGHSLLAAAMDRRHGARLRVRPRRRARTRRAGSLVSGPGRRGDRDVPGAAHLQHLRRSAAVESGAARRRVGVGAGAVIPQHREVSGVARTTCS